MDLVLYQRTRSCSNNEGAYGPYTIQVTQGVDLEHPFAQFVIVFEAKGDTHTHTCRHSSTRILPPSGNVGSQMYTTLKMSMASTMDLITEWRSLSLQAHPATNTSASPMAFGLSPVAEDLRI